MPLATLGSCRGPSHPIHGCLGYQRMTEPDATQMRYTALMKTATIPSVRVEPELRAEVESLLSEGETVSEFVEASVRATVMRRRNQVEFIARGLRSLEAARRTGDYADADVVVEGLQRKLEAARALKTAKRR